jgi:hypothetical protein
VNCEVACADSSLFCTWAKTFDRTNLCIASITAGTALELASSFKEQSLPHPSAFTNILNRCEHLNYWSEHEFSGLAGINVVVRWLWHDVT